MSKPKLLITMGCSYTEGVGCYDLETLPKDIHINKDAFYQEHGKIFTKLYEQNKDRFHELGWPNQLGKKLNYDMVLNLGLGGSSTSGQLKVFMEKYGDNDFKEYDVLVVWLLTEPTRFSFYSEYEVKNILPTHDTTGNLGKEYLNFIENINFDPLLEQIFYLKIMSKICKLNDWKFYCFHSSSHLEEYIKVLENFDFLLFQDEIKIFPESDHEKYTSPVCYHPNEFGYEYISKQMYRLLKNKNLNLINTKKVDKFSWKWDGNPSKKFDQLILNFKNKNKNII